MCEVEMCKCQVGNEIVRKAASVKPDGSDGWCDGLLVVRNTVHFEFAAIITAAAHTGLSCLEVVVAKVEDPDHVGLAVPAEVTAQVSFAVRIIFVVHADLHKD